MHQKRKISWSRCLYDIFAVLILSSSFMLSANSVHADGLDVLRSITEAVKELCVAPDRVGKYAEVRASGDGSAQLRIAGVKGNIALNAHEWSGIKDIARERQPTRDCAERILPLLLEKFAPDRSESRYTGRIFQCHLDANPIGQIRFIKNGRLLFHSTNRVRAEFMPTGLFKTLFFDSKGIVLVKNGDGEFRPLRGYSKSMIDTPIGYQHDLPCLIQTGFIDNILENVSANSVYSQKLQDMKKQGFFVHKASWFSCIGNDGLFHIETKSIVDSPREKGVMMIENVTVGQCEAYN